MVDLSEQFGESVRDSRPREVLPIPDRPVPGFTAYAATDPGAVLPPIERLQPPVGAPNVLVILLDDAGFGSSSAFGGPVQMPTAERLAGMGLRYTRFHTTAMCAPTRAALLSGRNHHSVGFGQGGPAGPLPGNGRPPARGNPEPEEQITLDHRRDRRPRGARSTGSRSRPATMTTATSSRPNSNSPATSPSTDTRRSQHRRRTHN